MEKQSKEQDFNKVESYIEHTGEVNWLVQDAINKEIAIPVIAQSMMELKYM
jgi:6-phosphogluconate dehydrogenase (decarboxylating)